MKNRVLWVFVAVIVLSAVALLVTHSPALALKTPHPEVAIQDGKTIDYSSGRPVVKDDAKQKAAIDKSTKEMDEAAKGVTFGSPTAKPAAPAKPFSSGKSDTKK